MERPVDIRRLKKEYLDLYEEITDILQKHDPFGIGPECPKGEYSPEAQLFVTRISQIRSLEDATIVMGDLLEEMAVRPSSECLQQIAVEVWDACQRHGVR